MSDAAVYVACRVTDLPAPHVPSQRSRCEKCASPVWIDPMQFVVAQAHEQRLRVLCVPCASPMLPEAAR